MSVIRLVTVEVLSSVYDDVRCVLVTPDVADKVYPHAAGSFVVEFAVEA